MSNVSERNTTASRPVTRTVVVPSRPARTSNSTTAPARASSVMGVSNQHPLNELELIKQVRVAEAIRRQEERERIMLLSSFWHDMTYAPNADSKEDSGSNRGSYDDQNDLMACAEAIFKRRMAREFAEKLAISLPRLEANVSEHPQFKRKLALLLPAHNEELIIESTIKSAIASGQELRDIYVVNDNSTDATQKIAVRMLGRNNVLKVGRSGKAVAVKKATAHFNFIQRYEWLHVADADSLFGQDYFIRYRAKLDPTKYAVAIGFVQSLKGNWISTYRALAYTYGQQVHRRVQSGLKMITVFPGPVTTIRTDIIDKLDYAHTGIAEDFDITLQVHRKKLGNIVYIPGAVNYTQDPQHLGDFIKQNQRWMRGYWQGVKKYGIGIHFQRIDLMLGSQMLMTLLFLVEFFAIAPYLLLNTPHGWITVLLMISLDYLVNCGVAIGSSIAARRWNLLGAMPYFYFLRLLEIGIHVWSFVEIFVLHKFSDHTKMGWSTAGRRYKLSSAALADAA